MVILFLQATTLPAHELRSKRRSNDNMHQTSGYRKPLNPKIPTASIRPQELPKALQGSKLQALLQDTNVGIVAKPLVTSIGDGC